MWLYFRLFLFALRVLRRDRRDLVLENLALTALLVAARSATSAGRSLMETASRSWHWPGASGARGRPTVRRVRR